MLHLSGEQRRTIWLWVAAIALSAGCQAAATLGGKSCPCVDGFTCCESTLTCMVDAAQCPPHACVAAQAATPDITSDAAPIPTDAGPPAVTFGLPPQWISFTFAAPGQYVPTLEATPDRMGIHVVATFTDFANTANDYEGVGLSFMGPDCLDGRSYSGIQFTVAGNLANRQTYVGVTSSDDLSAAYDQGICTGGLSSCYGPNQAFSPQPGIRQVPFTSMAGGMPNGTLDSGHIVNVNWQVKFATNLPPADFTITDVKFY